MVFQAIFAMPVHNVVDVSHLWRCRSQLAPQPQTSFLLRNGWLLLLFSPCLLLQSMHSKFCFLSLYVDSPAILMQRKRFAWRPFSFCREPPACQNEYLQNPLIEAAVCGSLPIPASILQSFNVDLDVGPDSDICAAFVNISTCSSSVFVLFTFFYLHT